MPAKCNTKMTKNILTSLGLAGGILLGAFLSKRLAWNCKQTLKAASIIAFIATICVGTPLVGCGGRAVVGSNVLQYYNRYT